MKECPCGIADVDCEYHKPARPIARAVYDSAELYINGVKLAIDDAYNEYYSNG